MGYLLTNHIVLPLYTRPLSYYWNQWYDAEGEALIDEAKVREPFTTQQRSTNWDIVLPRCWHHQLARRHLHFGCSNLEYNKATCGAHSENRHMLHVSAW
jgi:hypothetical protein